MTKKRGLGKGLEALFVENSEDNSKIITLNIGEIQPNKKQPRKNFNEESLSDLASSIAQHGILQPLIVRPFPDGTYQLVAGERRFRAAHMVGLSEVPVVIKELSDRQTAEIALIENLQREDLNPVEEAIGFQTLMSEYSLTQEEVSKAVGKSRSAVANALRLLTLTSFTRNFLAAGAISAGHARAILAFPDEESQNEVTSAVINEGLSVREVEKRAKSFKERSGKDAAKNSCDSENKAKNSAKRESFYDEVELALTENLGRKVVVSSSKKGGVLQIEYYSLDDLRMLINDVFPKE